MGQCFEPVMNKQSNLIVIVEFFDYKLCADLTNVIVRLLGNGSCVFVFDDAFKDIEPNTRQTRCKEVNNHGSHIEFCGLFHAGSDLHECYVLWSKHGIEAEVDKTGIDVGTMSKKECNVFLDTQQPFYDNRNLQFRNRYSVEKNMENKTQRFKVHAVDNDETNSFIINDVEDIGAKLHALLPFRFRTCKTMHTNDQKMT